MEFDIGRVYASISADDLKVGSKVILADTLTNLKDYVTDFDSSVYVETLTRIEDEYATARFVGERRSPPYPFAYLISEPEEKKLKWTDLKVGDVIRRKDGKLIRMVTGVDTENNGVELGCAWVVDEELDEWEKTSIESEDIPITVMFSYMNRLKDAQETTDIESGHAEADDVLCDLLTTLGYKKLVDEYYKVKKWYS